MGVLVIKRFHTESHVTCVTPVQFSTYNTPFLWSWFLHGWWNLAYKISFSYTGYCFLTSTHHFTFYSISIFYKKSVPQLTEFWLTIDVFFSLFYSYILSSHSEFSSVPYSFAYLPNGRSCFPQFCHFTQNRKKHECPFSVSNSESDKTLSWFVLK
jgi:hypothetical protein